MQFVSEHSILHGNDISINHTFYFLPQLLPFFSGSSSSTYQLVVEFCGYLVGPFFALYPVNWIPFLGTHMFRPAT
jgi:hypothetical protein